ncbi:MAG TPA: T9SS type A sorting domain-containing protein [Bacteroidales bacterium]|nr:T9SS type A sorting domain-containing protein [Bacteroidales bacterium]
MKRLLLIFATSIIVTLANGNMALPLASISEIHFSTDGSWTIELGFFFNYASQVDSISLESSSGSSIIKFYTLIPGGGFPNFNHLAVITNLNLQTPVFINPLADYVKTISYNYGYERSDYVAFGNYPGSFLDCKQKGESISYISYLNGSDYRDSFCVDKCPTIGIGNDTTGKLSRYCGKIYDPSGNVFTHGYFSLPPHIGIFIDIQPDGSFLETVFSRRYTFDTITIVLTNWPCYSSQTYKVEHVDFCVRPDSLHTQDIIATSLITAVDKREPDQESVVVVSPNPFTDKVTFFFNMRNPDPSDEISFTIYGRDGRQLKQIKPTAFQNKYEWIPDENIPTGVLVFHMKKNGKTVKTGKFLKL